MTIFLYILALSVLFGACIGLIIADVYLNERAAKLAIMAAYNLQHGHHITLYDDARLINKCYGENVYKIRKQRKTGKYRVIWTPRHKSDTLPRFEEGSVEVDTEKEAQQFVIDKIEYALMNPYSNYN